MSFFFLFFVFVLGFFCLFVFCFFAKHRRTNWFCNLLGCLRVSCGSIFILTASSWDNAAVSRREEGRTGTQLVCYLTSTIFIHPDQLVTFFHASSPLYSNKSISGRADWHQLPCGLTKAFTQAINEILFALSTPLSVFYNHVRESKICLFLLFLLPIFTAQLR